jgi:hypothetical protein
MTRPVTAAFVILAALGAGVEASALPEPVSAIQRSTAANTSHYVRGAGHKLPDPIRVGSNDRHRTSWQTHGVRGK